MNDRFNPTPKARFTLPLRRRWPLRLAAGLALAYLGLLALVYWKQEALIFAPQPLAPDHVFTIDDAREARIPVPGASLSALHLRLPAPRGLVFFLHGNGGNLESWFVNADFYRAANFDLFMLDYRGYGKSGGRIESEAQLRADVRAAWESVAPAYAGKPIVIVGRSLGSALAAGLAARVQPEATVLASPYCSMGELARLHYPFLPAALLRYPLDTCADVPRITGPLLLLHGEADTLVPIGQSERILARTPQARLVRVPGAGHNDLHRHTAYLEALRKQLAAL